MNAIVPFHRVGSGRVFLFLQGPHGPFFAELARALRGAGHATIAVGMNRGDAHDWASRAHYVAFAEPPEAWGAFLRELIAREGVTDLVLYGDTKPAHAVARDLAAARGLRVHCFEEGYLRPYWITYERGGANGNSRLNDLPLRTILDHAGGGERPAAPAPGHWGALWHHTWHGCIYHANILFRNRAYPHFRSHRAQSVWTEWLYHCKRLALMPWRAGERQVRTARLLASGRAYHVFILQLAHDASVLHHGASMSWERLIDEVVDGFATGASAHHQLVFKAHPLEDERIGWHRLARDAARRHGVSERVITIGGGRLGELLDHATSALTVNSTAGQQVLFRGLPLRIFGTCVYDRQEFVSRQALPDFFRRPQAPDLQSYLAYRDFLLATSQVRGGFYTRKSRAAAIRGVLDKMLAPLGPYSTRIAESGGCATTPPVATACNLTRPPQSSSILR